VISKQRTQTSSQQNGSTPNRGSRKLTCPSKNLHCAGFVVDIDVLKPGGFPYEFFKLLREDVGAVVVISQMKGLYLDK